MENKKFRISVRHITETIRQQVDLDKQKQSQIRLFLPILGADESQAAAGATLSHFGKRLWATAQLFSRPSRPTTKIGVASLKIKLTAIPGKIHGAEIT
ncbi:hypothetical protein CDAR_180731 [Caerostris darwini]|uniref:Uncharacterized protein n=1 Tax=Caerostris darwini TaxID=1538125 RepID=A0AAV4QX71_9ARAC|nr:hypothetical protein CDAR_180731 [Caerostris darwini]